MAESETMWFKRSYGMFVRGDEVVVIAGGDALTFRVHSPEKGYTLYAPRDALTDTRPLPLEFGALNLDEVRDRIERDSARLRAFVEQSHRARASGKEITDAMTSIDALVFRLGQFEDELRASSGSRRLDGLIRDVVAECAKSRPSKQALREAVARAGR